MSGKDLFDDLYFDFYEDIHFDALTYVNKIIKKNRDEIYIDNFEIGNNETYLDWYKVN